ncbi:MAG: aquaporin [Bryobacteraceae bacterium]|jgi:aquaporin Z
MRDHLPEYLAEFFGTAIMMMIGIGAIALMWGQGSPMRSIEMSDGIRRLLTGIMFAGGGTLVVLSPLGQRSGGHLNPAVTWAFWWKGQVKTPDAVLYSVAQCVGAIAGVGIIALVGGTFAKSVQLGLTVPGDGYSPLAAFVAEAGITFLLMFLILYCVNDSRVAAKTPYLAGALVALLVFLEAPVSGTSLNPARSFAPALWTQLFQFHWIYWIAPVLGAMASVPAFGWLFPQKRDGGCAKLFHTEHYRCIFTKCGYTHVPAGSVLLTQGDESDKAYVVERGELEVRKRGTNGAEQVLARLGPGDWVGEMSLLLNLPRSATVIATRDSQLRTVTAANFTHVIKEHPEETLRLLKQLSARLSQANDKLVL